MVVTAKSPKPPETTEDPMDNSSDKVLEESNEILLTILRFGVDNALGEIPPPLPAQHMFACYIGPPRSGKTSLSTAMLTQTSPNIYAGVFDHVYLFVPATSFASITDSPFRFHDKVSHELDKAALEGVIAKLEVASKKKENSLIIIDDFMASLKENTLRSALEKLISNRRHLRANKANKMSTTHTKQQTNGKYTDPRNRVTHYLLNGRPYDGAMHPIFKPGVIAPTYMTGPRHHAFSENLTFSVRPILIDSVPQIDLPRLPREPKTIYNTFKDAGIYDDILNNISGQPAINRSIIPSSMTPSLNGRERPTNSTTTQGFASPRGAVSGGRGDQVFYSRVPPSTTAPGPPITPDASGVLPPDLRPQPPYGTPVAQPVGGFQVNPQVTLAPFIPPPPPSTPLRPLFGPPQPIDFMRFQQGAQSSQSTQSAQSAPRQQFPALTFVPTSLPLTAGSKAPSTPTAYESDSSRGGGSGSRLATGRPAGVNKQGLMARKPEIERLGVEFTAADFEIMRGLSDRRNFPPRSPAEADEQRQRLETYPDLLSPIMDRYGDMQSIRARIAIGAVYGIHKSIVP
ncbi:hypothetical protein T492DRAFT_1118533 [Pavlovales sp. CCMP2436]|nr:hypothetical protein T492DRAFT_1118533 [Pavlovales sp. CCMP2436]